MELDVVEKSKTKLRFKIKHESHTFCNILRKELWNDQHIKIAGYNIEHPLVGYPLFVVETDGKESPKKALVNAVARLKSTGKEFKAQIQKIK